MKVLIYLVYVLLSVMNLLRKAVKVLPKFLWKFLRNAFRKIKRYPLEAFGLVAVVFVIVIISWMIWYTLKMS